jgi:hypothetical protein
MHVPGYYCKLAGENEGKVSDFVFLAGYDNIIAEAIEQESEDPKSLSEAQLCSNWPKWKEAMDHKIAMLKKAQTWCTIPRSPSKNIVGTKWVFCIKCNANRSINKYKAHLIACSFTQIHSVNFFYTYSPIARLSSIRFILAIAACYDWDIKSFDFIRAYLNRELDDNKEIYMQTPLGYSSMPNTVNRLHKSLYMLRLQWA